jgi:membrane fusion protein (multidrug efflux system)
VKYMSPTIHGLLLVICLSIGSGCSVNQNPHGGKETSGKRLMPQPRLAGYVVRPLPFERSIEVSGTIRPRDEAILMCEKPGRVVKLNLPEGGRVTKGTLLVKLFDGDLTAQLAKIDAQLLLAKQTLARFDTLLKVNGVSRTEYDKVLLQMQSLEADRAIILVEIGKTELRAPFDGVLGLRHISVGAQVSPSVPVATLQSADVFTVDFSVPGKYSGMVAPGSRCAFVPDGATAPLTATVIASDKRIDPASRTLTVRASVDGSADNLTGGSFAKVKVSLGGDADALLVPSRAIMLQEKNKKLAVVRKGCAVFVPVITGFRLDTLVEVTTGISAGDTVITTGLMLVKPGMPITFSTLDR